MINTGATQIELNMQDYHEMVTYLETNIDNKESSKCESYYSKNANVNKGNLHTIVEEQSGNKNTTFKLFKGNTSSNYTNSVKSNNFILNSFEPNKKRLLFNSNSNSYVSAFQVDKDKSADINSNQSNASFISSNLIMNTPFLITPKK